VIGTLLMAAHGFPQQSERAQNLVRHCRSGRWPLQKGVLSGGFKRMPA
jgi:hypothetical protein